jgi:phosphohistidine phosphatase SixA
VPLLIVRHAHAGRRGAWAGDDRDRPLSDRGRAQARALVPLLQGYRPARVLSSPSVRCHATVGPLAEALDLPVEAVDELAEGHGHEAVALVERMAGASAVLCTHGDVAAALLDGLAAGRPEEQRRELRLEKGGAWVVRAHGTGLAIVDHLHPDEGRRH